MITTETKLLVGIVVVTVAIIVGGAFWASRSQQASEAPVSDLTRLVKSDDALSGPADAKVTVVEFGDFQCPACAALYPAFKATKEATADQSVKFVFRHYPLSQHEFAQDAAEAAVAAQQQGKFWEFHDRLFENQAKLDRAGLEEHAQAIGLNLDEFRKALDEHAYRDAVAQDQADGSAVGVSGTPTVYINGVKYKGAYSAEALTAAINEAIKTP